MMNNVHTGLLCPAVMVTTQQPHTYSCCSVQPTPLPPPHTHMHTYAP